MYQNKFKRNMLNVALLSALQALAVSAYAEDVAIAADETATEAAEKAKAKDKDTEGAEIVEVTGLRAGIARAIDTKRESSSIVEAISAEDIGKLPDISIAEAIARLPGLTAQRVNGRASTIQIRGLADDFGTALLNGREQVSVGHNRGVEFDQYPSELLSAAVVYKTPDASLVGQGLSGTVDLRTASPLSYSDRVTALNVRMEKNSNGKLNPDTDDVGNRISGSFIDQFDDGKIGLALGFSHLDTPSQGKRWDSWGYAGQTVNGQDNVNVLGGTKAQAVSAENKRDGVMAVLELRPNEMWHSTFDAYYSKFKTEETMRFLEAGTVWISPCWWNCSPTDAVIEGNSVISGRFSGVNPVVRNDLNTSEDKLTAFGWKNEFSINDQWAATVDVSHSKADRDSMILETYAGLGYSVGAGNPFTASDTVTFAIDRNDFTTMGFNSDYADASTLMLTDPMGWGQDGYVKYPKIFDELNSFRISGERFFDSGVFSVVKFGINQSKREKGRSVSEFKMDTNVDVDGTPGADPMVAIPSSAIVGTVDLGFAGAPEILALDVRAIANSNYYTFTPNVHYDIYKKTWDVTEKVTTAFVQADIAATWGEIDVGGNIGVQMVHTDQSSNGTDPAHATPVTGGSTYDDMLPSLNLSFSGEDQVVRVALAKQIARARMDDLRASQEVNIATSGQYAGKWVGGGGNPDLQPWEAKALDISYEYYFGDKGYISVATFYKDLTTYIYNGETSYDFDGIDTSSYDPAIIPTSTVGVLSGPINGEGGTLKGWEAAVSVPFELISDSLNGFGIQASYTNIDTAINPNGPDGAEEPLPGMSDIVSNITFYYEHEGFSARVSQRHRTDFLGEVQGFGGDRSKVYVKGESVVDMQIGYSFSEASGLDGLSILLQANNLTDEAYRQYFADKEDLPQFYAKYGKTYLLGASYKF